MAMEISFPMCSSYRLNPNQLAGNTRFMKRICNMLPLQMTSQTCEKLIFHSGSRAEGLTLRVGWGHEEPDCDVMYTFSRLWGVPLQAPGNYTKALLASLMTAEPIGGIIALETGDAPPGFCRLRVYGDHGKMAEYMRSFGVRYTYPHVGRKRRMCIVERGGAHWISPNKVADLMLEERCIFRAKESVSPATVLKGGWVEKSPHFYFLNPCLSWRPIWRVTGLEPGPPQKPCLRYPDFLRFSWLQVTNWVPIATLSGAFHAAMRSISFVTLCRCGSSRHSVPSST